MRTLRVGAMLIPIDNIDYIREGADYRGDFIMLKSGARIECTREEYRKVEAQLLEASNEPA